MVAAIIAVLAAGAGFYATLRWAPPLRATRVGLLAAIVVANLVAAALVVVALDVYELIRTLGHFGPAGFADQKTDLVARTISDMLAAAGPLLGLAAAVHLLAPPPDEA